jgi:hypothetical protein
MSGPAVSARDDEFADLAADDASRVGIEAVVGDEGA